MTNDSLENAAHVDRYNALWESANRASDGLLLIGPTAPKTLGCFARRRARHAIRCCRECLVIHPESWQAYWMMGKVHQALGEHTQAHEAFDESVRINPTQVDVLREAAIEASFCGKFVQALDYAHRAFNESPEDAGLLGNIAAIYMKMGRLQEAEAAAEEAVRMDPSDSVNVSLLKYLRSQNGAE